MQVNKCTNKPIILYVNNTKYAYKDKQCSIKFSKVELINAHNKGCLIYQYNETDKKEIYEIPFACIEYENYCNINGANFDVNSSEYIEESTI